MARVKNGVNGAPSGKVGAVVFCKWKGINYVRSLPKVKKRRKLSDSEVKNRSKFGFAQNFLSPYKKFFRLGFHHYGENMTAFNAAMSYHLEHAVKVDENGPFMDYGKFAISRGLEEAITAATVEIVDEKLHIRWQLKNRDELFQRELTDFKVIFLLLPETSMFYADSIFLGNNIIDLKETVVLPKVNSPCTFHLYLGFVATDGSNRSMNSVYLGHINVDKE